MEYYKADNKEIQNLVNMRVAYLNEDYGHLESDVIEKIISSLPDYFEKHLNNDLFAYVAKDTEIVATALLLIVEKPANPSFISGKTGVVLNVYTKEDYRRKGIANKLMKMLLSDAEKLKLDYVELKATNDGYNLYKSLGFKDSVSEYKPMKYEIGK